jgi:pyruvate dehydrogenase E1 component
LDEAALKSADYYTMEAQESLQHAGSPLPMRSVCPEVIPTPSLADMASLLDAKGVLSTTTSFVRIMSFWLRVAGLKERVVPIVADEARTFGMEGLFKNLGVYQATGAQFTSHDLASLTGYRDSDKGQLLQAGIDEAGAMATWLACATSYSVNHLPLLPCYIFYAMFGFQRVMDLIWAAADSRARGFLLGAISGRTTLSGEGLQHADGHSVLLADVVPGVVWYDPMWHYEMVIIMQHYAQEMLEHHRDVIVYITLVNEGIEQQSMPQADGVVQGVINGMYRFSAFEGHGNIPKIVLLGSGAIFHQVHKVYRLLCKLGISCELMAVTSYGMLKRSILEGTLDPLESALGDKNAFVVAASDYVCHVPEMIRPYVCGDYVVCGTDGFGMSDTRDKLREHFGVDAKGILAALSDRLLRCAHIDQATIALWQEKLGSLDEQ